MLMAPNEGAYTQSGTETAREGARESLSTINKMSVTFQYMSETRCIGQDE